MDFPHCRPDHALAILLLLFLLNVTCSAKPYIPANGAQVIEYLPVRANPIQRELLKLRSELSKEPKNLPLASILVRRYIEQARIEGDPRYLGYAQAALAPWWKQRDAPDEVLVLRATLFQSTHRFAAALADLDTVLRRDTGNAQAWLTRATVQMVTGDLVAAKGSCMRLYSRAPALIVQTCLSNVGSLNGDAKSSFSSLKAMLERYPDTDPKVRGWTQTLLAEMAARNGDDVMADTLFRQALDAGEPDSYLLGAWSDFLLDRGRSTEVAKLLKDKGRIDALLLRYAIALKNVGSTDAKAQTEALRSRFNAAMLRGDTVHQREQARFELVLNNDSQSAVRLALLNWAVQKEPADLRILIESAVASGNVTAAKTALDWIAKFKIEDRTIARPLAKLRALGQRT
ncbi:hypothetical protein ACQ4W6_12855 [Janthinobacterium sp. HLX7-2]